MSRSSLFHTLLRLEATWSSDVGLYPKHGLQAGISVPKFLVSYFVKAGGYLVQRCWFIRE